MVTPSASRDFREGERTSMFRLLSYFLVAACCAPSLFADCSQELQRLAVPVSLQRLGGSPASFEVSPSGGRMLAGLHDGRVVELDGAGKTIRVLTSPGAAGRYSLATYTGDDTPVVVVSATRTFYLGDPASPATRHFRV